MRVHCSALLRLGVDPLNDGRSSGSRNRSPSSDGVGDEGECGLGRAPLPSAWIADERGKYPCCLCFLVWLMLDTWVSMDRSQWEDERKELRLTKRRVRVLEERSVRGQRARRTGGAPLLSLSSGTYGTARSLPSPVRILPLPVRLVGLGTVDEPLQLEDEVALASDSEYVEPLVAGPSRHPTALEVTERVGGFPELPPAYTE